MSYKVDPNHTKKQVFAGITYGHQQFLGVFSTNAEITGMKAVKGSVAFSTESGNGRLYIYNGSGWKYINCDG